jgi:WD40 repeat protein
MSNKSRSLLLAVFLSLTAQHPARSDSPDSKLPVRTDFYGDPLPPGAVARLGTIRLRHGGEIGSVTFSPDGKILASGGEDHLIKFWDPDSGKEQAILKGHSETVWSVAFGPDSKSLASGSADKTIKIWDLSQFRPGLPVAAALTLKGHTEPVRSVVFSPDGHMLASVSEDATVKLWSLDEWRVGRVNSPLFTLKGHRARVFSVAFSPDGKTLASASDDKTVRLWDAASGQSITILPEPNFWPGAVAFSPNGKILVSGDENGDLRFWHMTQGRVEAAKPTMTTNAHTGPILSLTFSLDGKKLASGSWASGDHTVKVWDLSRWAPDFTAPPVRALEGHFGTVNSLTFSPDGKTLAAGGADNAIKLWDVASGMLKPIPANKRWIVRNPNHELERAHSGSVAAVAFCPDGRAIATGGSTDRTVRIWPLSKLGMANGDSTGGQCHTRQAEMVSGLSFSPDGKSLASNGWGPLIHIWDMPSLTNRDTLEAPLPAFPSLAHSPDGRLLASTTFHGPLQIWDLKSRRLLKTLKGPTWFHSVAFNSDGTRIAAGGGEGTIKLFNSATGREWASLTHRDELTFSVAFSTDGKTLATGNNDDEVILWDMVAAKSIGALKGHEESVRAVAFSPDGKTLASGGDDGFVKLWDLTKCRTGTFSPYVNNNPNVWYRNDSQTISQAKLVHDFAGHLAHVTGVAFSPDGRILASSSGDTTALLWNVAKLQSLQVKQATRLRPDEITCCWIDLAGENASKAYEAIWTLASAPGQAVPFIKDHLRPAASDGKRIAQLIADLDSNDFATRNNAIKDLEKLQDFSGPFLREQLKKNLSLEVRRRLEQLLEKIEGPVTDPEQLRGLRAVEILEHIGTSEAREVLQTLAKGAPETRLTQEAKGSLQRLDKQASKQVGAK